MRKVQASARTALDVKRKGRGRIEIYSFFPCDRGDCKCQGIIKKWKERLAVMNDGQKEGEIRRVKFLTCPRDKTGMSRYQISCKKCGEVLGYCWATDDSLSDWCDLHYVNWTDGKQWHGCLTPHISPITQELCFECCCGADTRDFRANMTISEKRAMAIEKTNSIGRGFGKTKSAFQVRKVANSMLPFK